MDRYEFRFSNVENHLLQLLQNPQLRAKAEKNIAVFNLRRSEMKNSHGGLVV